MRKVPAVTLHFWAVKILSTAMGEALSDYLVHTISPYEAVGLGFIGFVIAIVFQFAVRRYIAPVYWLCVVMVAVFGTMVADALHIEMGIPYATSAFDCAVTLAAIFAIWYLVERNLSIHSINSPRREAFYWATVLATFAMGTALGDLSSYTWHLGWFASGLMYTALFAIPLLARRFVNLNWLVAFWWAYIVTRPLGASYADWLGVPQALGGLDFGRARVALALTLVIIAWVAYLTVSRVDVEQLTPVRVRASESGS
ncbi:MAG TPA: hypothetical protein VJS19_09050 [Candidatus Dormibacteraeota bacterium]|nr:hypothetical protein [Candidatus Dormibacteraeota bacterium]